jgi:hypothetical protein
VGAEIQPVAPDAEPEAYEIAPWRCPNCGLLPPSDQGCRCDDCGTIEELWGGDNLVCPRCLEEVDAFPDDRP